MGATEAARRDPTILSAILKSAAFLEQVNQQNHNGDHKNDVDKAPGNLKAVTEHPKNHKDHKDSPEHSAPNFSKTIPDQGPN